MCDRMFDKSIYLEMSTFCNYFMGAGVVKSSESYNIQVPTYIGLYMYKLLSFKWKGRKEAVGLPGFLFIPVPLYMLMLYETFLQKQFKFKKIFSIISNICSIINLHKCLRFDLCTIYFAALRTDFQTLQHNCNVGQAIENYTRTIYYLV